jgi:hypothetical protein
MNIKGSGILSNCEGKGFFGCMVAIVLLAAMIFAAVKLGPIYYSNYLFEDELKGITSQAGARFVDNDEITRQILDAARKLNIRITPEDAKKNIKIERFAGQIHITVRYFVPVDFLIFKKTFEFQSRNSSFTAT